MEFDIASLQEMITTVFISLALTVVAGAAILAAGWSAALWVRRRVEQCFDAAGIPIPSPELVVHLHRV